MSYQVLARKWRPRRFAELVGQEHVVRALTHALDSGRIHHAFLFTGTRGVGKTTIARIFAKSLNCERGIGSNPCGECGSCKDIDAGRFLDLLEIDAASNTGVDDVREVIENAQYRPARGNYKVYLIDEVHMLSKNAFNALLKTLEEPPEHAKFLLATTDPQKLPVTVLSRCLQFNLKRLSEEQIAAQVAKILTAEAIEGDAGSVAEIARAGNGSLRDALSLLDQAIAFGGGALRADEVRTMLGTVDRGRIAALLEAVVAGDATLLMQRVEDIATYAPAFETVLDELAALLHRVQLAQLVPGASADEPGVAANAGALHPEQVQLLYQIAVTGRRDLAHAPSPRAGFEMCLLRMLAFRPFDSGAARTNPPATRPAPVLAGAPVRTAPVAAQPVGGPVPRSHAIPVTTPERPLSAVTAASAPAPATPAGPALDPTRWADVLGQLELRGPLRELAHNAVLIEHAGDRLRLGLAPMHEHLKTDGLLRKLTDALAPVLGTGLRIQFEAAAAASGSLAERERRERSERQSAAESAVSEDPFVRDAMAQLGARLVPNSTRPNEAK